MFSWFKTLLEIPSVLFTWHRVRDIIVTIWSRPSKLSTVVCMSHQALRTSQEPEVNLSATHQGLTAGRVKLSHAIVHHHPSPNKRTLSKAHLISLAQCLLHHTSSGTHLHYRFGQHFTRLMCKSSQTGLSMKAVSIILSRYYIWHGFYKHHIICFFGFKDT